MDKAFRTLDDTDVRDKRVLLRLDLNVPTEKGEVTDTTRLERVVPTIREIADTGRMPYGCVPIRSRISAGRKGATPRTRLDRWLRSSQKCWALLSALSMIASARARKRRSKR